MEFFLSRINVGIKDDSTLDSVQATTGSSIGRLMGVMISVDRIAVSDRCLPVIMFN